MQVSRSSLLRTISAVYCDRDHDLLLVCAHAEVLLHVFWELTEWNRVNYGVLGEVNGTAVYVLPLSLQAVPAV